MFTKWESFLIWVDKCFKSLVWVLFKGKTLEKAWDLEHNLGKSVTDCDNNLRKGPKLGKSWELRGLGKLLSL